MTISYNLWSVVFTWCIPKLIVDVMHENQSVTNLFYLGHSITVVTFLYVIGKFTPSAHVLYKLGAVTFFVMIIHGSTILIIYRTYNLSTKITCLVLQCAMLAVIESGEKVFLLVTYSKMLTSKHQGVGESFRITMKRLSAIVAGVVVLYILDYFVYSIIVLVVNIVIILCCMKLRKCNLCEPRQII